MKNRVAIRIFSLLFALSVGLFGGVSALAAGADAFPQALSSSQPAGDESAPPDESAPAEDERETTEAEEPQTPEALLPEEPVHLSGSTGVLFTFIAILAVVVLVRVVAKRGRKDENDDSYNESYY